MYKKNKAFQSVVFNSGQKMALVAFLLIKTLAKALTYYYINRSQRTLLATFEKKQLEGPIEMVSLDTLTTGKP